MTTIKNVAKLAGVSTSTASRALHNSDMISEATKERVRRAMQELDYSPNYSAQNLVNRTTNTIWIVLPVRERQDSLGNNPFFMQIIQGISKFLVWLSEVLMKSLLPNLSNLWIMITIRQGEMLLNLW